MPLAQVREIVESARSAEQLGIVGILLLVIAGLVFWLIVGGVRRWWVWGWHYTERIEQDRIRYEEKAREAEQWKAMALRGTSLVERVIDGR